VSGGPKVSRRRHRDVELKRIRQQEDVVRGRIAGEVGKAHRVELVERARPALEHVRDRHVVGHREREIQVGEPVAFVDGERTDGGSGDDTVVLGREPKHARAQSIPLLDGEHEARS
jgi:hypothetical protein